MKSKKKYKKIKGGDPINFNNPQTDKDNTSKNKLANKLDEICGNLEKLKNRTNPVDNIKELISELLTELNLTENQITRVRRVFFEEYIRKFKNISRLLRTDEDKKWDNDLCNIILENIEFEKYYEKIKDLIDNGIPENMSTKYILFYLDKIYKLIWNLVDHYEIFEKKLFAGVFKDATNAVADALGISRVETIEIVEDNNNNLNIDNN